MSISAPSNTFKTFSSRCKKGFTLVEMLVVISIILIITVAVMSAINPIAQQKKARDVVRRSDLSKMSTALEQYYADHNSYPVGTGAAVPYTGSLDTYMNSLPADPVSATYSYCYNTANSNQDYVLCSALEYGTSNENTTGTPVACNVKTGTQPYRYCVRNPF